MNKQFKIINGERMAQGIEWCDWTWNVVGGCLHDCQWVMPDGQVAECYAKTVAERVAQAHYPHGFRHHYFHANRLEEPLRLKVPSRIFPDSMADLLGNWVKDEEITQVMDVMREAHWHVFCLLTKNPMRYKRVVSMLSPNIWCGASSPPDYMWGKRLTLRQREKMFVRTLEAFAALPADQIKWLSIEPLSWDIAPLLDAALVANPHAVKWVVIGAASNGAKTHQPDPAHLNALLAVCDSYAIPVFYKGNLSPALVPSWREEFPANDPLYKFDDPHGQVGVAAVTEQMEMAV